LSREEAVSPPFTTPLIIWTSGRSIFEFEANPEVVVKPKKMIVNNSVNTNLFLNILFSILLTVTPDYPAPYPNNRL
jgi:hypothetical protein